MLVVAGMSTIAGAAVLDLGTAGLRSSHTRAIVTGVLTCVVGVAGVVAGIAALMAPAMTMTARGVLPLSQATFAVDPLSGLFMAIAGGVAVATGVYSVGYPRGSSGHDTSGAGGAGSRTAQAALPLFAAAIVLVPTAGNVTTFLVLWELMALFSLVLVLAEHRSRPEVGRAGIWYAAITHAGLVVILIGLVVLASAVGGESFAVMREAGADLPTGVRSAVFVLTFAGFASKAGLVPAHVYLPRAEPEAPSHVSALMSAAMSSLGVYGVLRVGFDLLGNGPRWWWLLVLVVGVLSGLYGVLQASVATDLMKLLAYSTTENLGLVFVGVGAAGMFVSGGDAMLASLLMVGALLHTVNHAAFKTVLFLGAGAVMRSTGIRDLDRLGGLARRMPVTTLLVGLGALCASGLPPGNGFVSEWLLLQGLIHSLSGSAPPDVVVAVAMPLAVGAVALTAGLGVAAFVKAFGLGFLARARTPEAARALEVPGTMRAGMTLAAVTCLVLAVAPLTIIERLQPVVAALPRFGEHSIVGGSVRLQLSGIAGSMSPLLIALGVTVGSIVVARFARLLGGRQPRRAALVWGGGGTRLSPRMEYTATAFAEPLTRVFDDVLRPVHDIDITHYVESRYLVESVSYRQTVSDRFEAHLYLPLVAAANRWAQVARRLQNGSVHRYLAYGLVGLLVALAALGLTS